MAVEQIRENLWRIGVTLPKSPLKELNTYYIRGEESDLLIDTGYRREECREALAAGLKEVGYERERTDILLTHMHSDHTGLAKEFAGENRKIYISEIDLAVLTYEQKPEGRARRFDRYRKEGFPTNQLDILFMVPFNQQSLDGLDNRFTGLKDGEELKVGGYTLRHISVPGHTPGNAMFYDEEKKLMFTGDHVLFDISPNITVWLDVPDSLGDYIDSLKKVLPIEVDLALPGHRMTGNYRERIETLIAHHGKRLEEILGDIEANPGISAYELSSVLKWRIRARSWDEFPLMQKWFAVGECMAHLDYLMKRGKVRRESQGGIYSYYVTTEDFNGEA